MLEIQECSCFMQCFCEEICAIQFHSSLCHLICRRHLLCDWASSEVAFDDFASVYMLCRGHTKIIFPV